MTRWREMTSDMLRLLGAESGGTVLTAPTGPASLREVFVTSGELLNSSPGGA